MSRSGVDIWVTVAQTMSNVVLINLEAEHPLQHLLQLGMRINFICSSELTPLQVREALRNTANNNSTRINVYGWGLINAYDAMLYWGTVWSNGVEITYKRRWIIS